MQNPASFPFLVGAALPSQMSTASMDNSYMRVRSPRSLKIERGSCCVFRFV